MHDGFCFCCCSDITCSEMRKGESFGQHIMSKDKYTTIFLRQSYCVYLPSNIFPRRGESVYEQFTVYYIGCSLFSVRWYNCMNTKTYTFFCNNHKTLSNLELNLKRRLLSQWTQGLKMGEYHVGYIHGYSPVLFSGYSVK